MIQLDDLRLHLPHAQRISIGDVYADNHYTGTVRDLPLSNIWEHISDLPVMYLYTKDDVLHIIIGLGIDLDIDLG